MSNNNKKVLAALAVLCLIIVFFADVGVGLGSATTLPEVFSTSVLLPLVALALLPWIARGLLAWRRRRRVYRDFARPAHFDANLVVIGAGVAGRRCARIAARLAARVVLIERQADRRGSAYASRQALMRSARLRHLLGQAKDFGVGANAGEADFRRVMERAREAASADERQNSLEPLARLGVECLQGEARLTSPWTVQLAGREIRARAIVLATGSRPRIPTIPGLKDGGYITVETVWNLRKLPRRLLVLGGGPRGCELAQAFARLGTQVALLENGSRLLPAEDADVSAAIAQALEAEGIRVLCGFRLGRIGRSGDVRVGFATRLGQTVEIAFDELLLALGDRPDLRGLGFEALGMEEELDGLELDGFLATRFPNILACGDEAEPLRSDQVAAFRAWYTAFNALFEPFARLPVKRRAVPWALYTDPEVARVGLSEGEARARRLPFETLRYEMVDTGCALMDGESRGFVKVLCAAGSDRILGAVIVGTGAAELIQPLVLAMTHGLGLDKLRTTFPVHFSRAEALRQVARQRRRWPVPGWLHAPLARFHRWRRGA